MKSWRFSFALSYTWEECVSIFSGRSISDFVIWRKELALPAASCLASVLFRTSYGLDATCGAACGTGRSALKGLMLAIVYFIKLFELQILSSIQSGPLRLPGE